MNLDQLEIELTSIVASLDEDEFIYSLLSAYGHPRASIARLRKGTSNLLKKSGELLWKKNVFFRIERRHDLGEGGGGTT
jgi:hypothetical protein